MELIFLMWGRGGVIYEHAFADMSRIEVLDWYVYTVLLCATVYL